VDGMNTVCDERTSSSQRERERERAEIFKKNINLSTAFLKIQI